MAYSNDGKPARDFSKDLWWSMGKGATGVEDILRDPINFPGLLRIEKTHETDDRNGVDYWVHLLNGDRIGVDNKARTPDWAERGRDDLTLEILSDIERQTPGCTRDVSKHCDYINFFWPTTGRWCLLPFRPLLSIFLQHWQEWEQVYKCNTETTRAGMRSWRSKCVFVPRRLVIDLIEAQYGGVPALLKKPPMRIINPSQTDLPF